MIKKILLQLWQLPQNIVGLIVSQFTWLYTVIEYKDAKIRVCPDFPGGISLGYFIIVNNLPCSDKTWNSIKHEYGHSLQSLYLGPLYLLVVGLPSLLWAAFYKYNPANPNGYYTFYTEKWADKLGEVIR